MPTARAVAQSKAIPGDVGPRPDVRVEPLPERATDTEAVTGAGSGFAAPGISSSRHIASRDRPPAKNPRVFDPERHCGAPTNPLNGSKPCTQGKGWGTDHHGAGNCRLHFGKSPTGERHAAKEQAIAIAKNALAHLHVPADVDPLESLLEAMRIAAWRELGLRQMLQGRTALFGVNHLGDETTDVVAEMHRDALDQRAKIAKLCIDAGLDARMVGIAERQADVVVKAIAAGLTAAGVTDPDLRAVAQAAVVQVLAVRMPTGVELN